MCDVRPAKSYCNKFTTDNMANLAAMYGHDSIGMGITDESQPYMAHGSLAR